MKQKIVYFVHCFPPAIGGLEFLSGEIVKILREAGHDVQVITGRGQTLDSYKTLSNWVESKNDPQHIHRLPLNFFWQRIANKFLNKLIFISGSFSPWYFGPILKYDDKFLKLIKEADLLIGAGMPTKMFYDAYRFAKKYKKRLILHPSYHDVNYYNRSIFFQKALSYADTIIYQTPLEKDNLIENYQLNQKKLVQLTYCPYTKDDWQKAAKRAQIKEKELQNKIKNKLPITIGYVGQITLRKNLQFFVDFIKENQQLFQKERLNINFLFAGARTNSSPQVEELFSDYKDLVKFVYDFKDKDKEKLFNQIDIFINPSKEESLGLVNFEAIYLGLPIFINPYSAFSSFISLNNNNNNNNFLKKINFLKLKKINHFYKSFKYCTKKYFTINLSKIITKHVYNI